jgi:glycosyltransferase involved in cell wall biosynthesis
MSLSYDLETLIRCVSGMDDVTLDIAGNGPDRQRLMDLAERLKTRRSNIMFHDYLNEAELASLLLTCDAGVIPMFPDSCVGVPGKMADYAAAGLKVVECLGGETAGLVDRFGVGTHYQAGDVTSLRNAIASVKNINNENARAEFARNFDATEVMDGYVEWVSGVMRCKKGWGNT